MAAVDWWIYFQVPWDKMEKCICVVEMHANSINLVQFTENTRELMMQSLLSGDSRCGETVCGRSGYSFSANVRMKSKTLADELIYMFLAYTKKLIEGRMRMLTAQWIYAMHFIEI